MTTTPDPVATLDHRRHGLRIAMALYGDLTYDSRVLREAATLADAGHEVTVYCVSGGPAADVSFRVATHAPARSAIVVEVKSQHVV